MNAKQFYERINEFAPKSLSDEYCALYGAYDNSGLLVDCAEEITGAVVSLDLTEGAIAKAKALDANLIVTHHPAIYGKLAELSVQDGLSRKVSKCMRGGISVVCMHLNVDCAESGIDEALMQGVAKVCGGFATDNVAVQKPLKKGSYGKAYDVKEISATDFLCGMQKEFSSQSVRVIAKSGAKISRVASFCGSGVDEEAIAWAKAQGADTVLSSDWKHHLILDVFDSGMTAVTVSHYASENYGFQKYYEKIRRAVDIPCVYHTDEELL